jgi:hypothetical protein
MVEMVVPAIFIVADPRAVLVHVRCVRVALAITEISLLETSLLLLLLLWAGLLLRPALHRVISLRRPMLRDVAATDVLTSPRSTATVLSTATAVRLLPMLCYCKRRHRNQRSGKECNPFQNSLLLGLDCRIH